MGPGSSRPARRLLPDPRSRQADAAAREAIALHLDVEPGDIVVSVKPELSNSARHALARVEQAKQAAREAAAAERASLQQAADVLSREFSQRDASRILGVSHQRLRQLKKLS